MLFLKKEIGHKEKEQMKVVRSEMEKSIAKIEKIRKKMKSLVQESAALDSNGEKINACEYRILKEELGAEEIHFKDLSRTLQMLNSAVSAKERGKALSDILKLRSTFDVDELEKKENLARATREVMEEENRSYAEFMETDDAPDYMAMKEDEEFSRLVERARVEKNGISEEKSNATESEMAGI